MSGRVKEVTDNSLEGEVLQANKPVLVDFWADQVLEIFDGDAEPAPRGCVAQASRVSELLWEAVDVVYEKKTMVLAGGCLWGVDAVFKHVKGVTDVRSGYAGGKGSASYEEVSTGDTGYAESVQITYDPSKITYGKLLKVFFSVAHDPTEVNRQGPDKGTQYRSAIFYSSDAQKRTPQPYSDQL